MNLKSLFNWNPSPTASLCDKLCALLKDPSNNWLFTACTVKLVDSNGAIVIWIANGKWNLDTHPLCSHFRRSERRRLWEAYIVARENEIDRMRRPAK